MSIVYQVIYTIPCLCKADNMSREAVHDSKIEIREAGAVPLLFQKVSFTTAFPRNKTPVLFLDFDGTLSEIVSQPEDAAISNEMKRVLKRCASEFITAIISGRDMDDVKARVNINEVIYAGSHGFRISGPNDLFMEQKRAEKLLPRLDELEEKLKKRFSNGPPGVRVERKRYAIAVHYRNADEGRLEEIQKITKESAREFPGFKTGTGKKIIEIRPDIDWHKGKAIKWILESLNLWDNNEIFPIYIGDDITDEDGFRMVYNNGLGILVGSHGQPTAAKYKLKNVDEVRLLLQKLMGQDRF
jgi:trehalose 6-phosphate phosphatase